MATLLDLLQAGRQGAFGPPTSGLAALVANNAARAQGAQSGSPGLSAPPQQPQQGQGGFGGFLSKLFAGPNDPNLSAEQNAAINKDALTQAGLGMLASSSGFDHTPTLGQAVAAGGSVGRGAAGFARDRALQELAAQQAAADQDRLEGFRADVLSQVDPGDRGMVNQAMTLLLANSDIEGVKSLVDISGAIPESQIVQQAGGGILHYNPNTEELTTLREPPEPPKDTQLSTQGDVTRLVDKQTGDVIAEWDHKKFASATDLRTAMREDLKISRQINGEFFRQSENTVKAINLADVATAEVNETGATAQTVIVALNKILDENSVVRESEFARVEQIGSALERLNSIRTKLRDGTMDEQIMTDIRNEIARLRRAAAEHLRGIAEPTIQQAQENGLNPDYIVNRRVQSLYQGIGPDGSVGGLPDIAGMGG